MSQDNEKTISELRSMPAIQEDEVDLLQLAGVIWRGRRLIIGFTAAATALILAYAVISLVLPPDKSPLPNIYKPEAMLLLNSGASSGGLQSLIASSGLGSLASLAGVSTGSTYGELAVELLKSGVVLDPISREFHIAQRYHIKKAIVDNSRKTILKHSIFVFDPKTNTLTISYKDYNPRFARDVVNRMVQILQERFVSIGGSRDLTREHLLEQKLVGVKAQIDELADEVENFQRTHGFLTINSLATVQTSALARLQASLVDTEMQIKTYSRFARIDDPTLARLRAERNNLQNLVNEMEHGYTTYSRIGPTQNDLPSLALQFEKLTRNLEVQVKIYEVLMQQYELAKLAAQGEEPTFQVLKLADVPDLKAGPSRALMVILTAFASFMLSTILVITRNSVRRIKSDPAQLRRLRGEAS